MVKNKFEKNTLSHKLSVMKKATGDKTPWYNLMKNENKERIILELKYRKVKRKELIEEFKNILRKGTTKKIEDAFNKEPEIIITDGIKSEIRRINFNITNKEIAKHKIKAIMSKINKDENKKYKIAFERNLDGENNYGTAYVSYDILIDKVNELLNEIMAFYDEFLIKRIIIEVIDNDKKLFGQGGMLKQYENEKYHIISPSTKYNCFEQCVIICEDKIIDYENNKDIVCSRAKRLKNYVYSVHSTYSDNEDIQKICNHKKLIINVYDGNMKLLEVFYPSKIRGKRYKTKEPIDIMLFANHYHAMIKKNNNNDIRSIKKKEHIVLDNDDDKLIKTKIFTESVKNNKYISWDIEATPDKDGNFKSYAVGLYDGNNFKYWWGLDCLTQMCNYLNDNRKKYNNYTLYAHNSGKFDTLLLLKECLLFNKKFALICEGNINKHCVEFNGRWLNITLKTIDNNIIYLKDSYALLNESLNNLTIEFNVDHKKLSGSIDHDSINLDNYNENKNNILKYLEHDIKGLYEIIEIFSNIVWNETKNRSVGINITDCMTCASLAKKYFFLKYNAKKTPIYTLSEIHDNFIRKYYYGGRVEIFKKLGKQDGNKFYYYDFTSLYPAMMLKLLPCGKPIYIENCKNIVIDKFFGFIRCKVKTICYDKKPLHAYSLDGKLLFPHFHKYYEMVLFSEEIKLGIKYNLYEYEFIDALEFTGKLFMRKDVQEIFNKKHDNVKSDNKVLAKFWKTILNSSYGFWGLKPKRDTIKIYRRGQSPIKYYLDNDKLKNHLCVSEYTLLKIEELTSITERNVSIASAISSYGRCELWSLMNDIDKHNGVIFMCDTDSIITDIDITEYNNLKSKYMKDGEGNELGSLKNELNKILKLNDRQYYFDSLYTNGAKFYSLKKFWSPLIGEIEINKCKNYSQNKEIHKLCHNDYTYLSLKQEVKQFSTGINYMSDNMFNVKLNTVNKHIKIQYLKSKVDNNSNLNTIILN